MKRYKSFLFQISLFFKSIIKRRYCKAVHGHGDISEVHCVRRMGHFGKHKDYTGKWGEDTKPCCSELWDRR